MRQETGRARIDAALDELFGAGVSLGAERTVRLEFRGDVAITLEHPEPGSWLHLHAPVAAGSDPALCRRALGLNLFGVSPAGAWLAHDDAADALLLCRTLPGEIDAAGLDAALSEHLAGVAELRRRLKESAPEPAAEAASERDFLSFRL